MSFPNGGPNHLTHIIRGIKLMHVKSTLRCSLATYFDVVTLLDDARLASIEVSDEVLLADDIPVAAIAVNRPRLPPPAVDSIRSAPLLGDEFTMESVWSGVICEPDELPDAVLAIESFFLWWKPKLVPLRRYLWPDCRSTLVPAEARCSLVATDITDASRLDDDWLEVRFGSIWHDSSNASRSSSTSTESHH